MSALVKCKACGYIMEEAKLGTVCPACGVPAKQFEAFDDRLSEKRRKILSLHLHPVIVHLPQGFAAFLVLLAVLLALLGAGSLRESVLAATRVMSVVLPLGVLLAFGAGLFDGKIRFKRVTTPILVKKMFAGASFFILSTAAASIALFVGLDGGLALLGFGLLEFLGLGAGALLGIWGTGLVVAHFPG
jgi:rubredoxin/uncharacterized membrane protein YqaE (UPF0057 family)